MKWVARDSVKEFVDNNADAFSSAMSEFIVRNPGLSFKNVLIVFAKDTMDYSDDPDHNLNRKIEDGIITNGEHMLLHGYWNEKVEYIQSDNKQSHIVGIFVNPDKYNHQVKNCINTLWHELTHVVQHKSGSLRVTDKHVLWHDKIHMSLTDYNSTNLSQTDKFNEYTELPWEIEARSVGNEGVIWFSEYAISKQYGVVVGKLINIIRKWF